MGGVQERAELEAWRERVRAKYEEVGYGAQIPPDLPRQLQVGQRVTARHPVTRQIHDGDILTTAPKYYRFEPPGHHCVDGCGQTNVSVCASTFAAAAACFGSTMLFAFPVWQVRATCRLESISIQLA